MRKNIATFPVGALTTILFFAIGFLTGKWQYAWLVFLANPIFYWFFNTFQKDEKPHVEPKDKDEEEDELDF